MDIEDVKRLKLAPGDVLVLRTGPGTTAEKARVIADQLAPVFPDNKVVTMSNDVELAVVEPVAA